jgi:hypothetical protein
MNPRQLHRDYINHPHGPPSQVGSAKSLSWDKKQCSLWNKSGRSEKFSLTSINNVFFPVSEFPTRNCSLMMELDKNSIQSGRY